jgi:hypothetical protein
MVRLKVSGCRHTTAPVSKFTEEIPISLNSIDNFGNTEPNVLSQFQQDRAFEFMWQRLNNTLISVQSYSTLSPSIQVRRQVNRALRDRPTLTSEEWAKEWAKICHQDGIARALGLFVYTHLQRYSGIEFGKVRLSDRLNEDLQWTEICWFDWDLALCDDFQQFFGVDISEYSDQLDLPTVGELVAFLHRQLEQC